MTGVEFHYTIDLGTVLGSLLTTVGFLVGATAIVISTRGSVRSLGARMQAVETGLQRVGDVLVEQGRQDEKINGLTTMLNQLTARVNDLAHGHGFIDTAAPVRRR